MVAMRKLIANVFVCSDEAGCLSEQGKSLHCPTSIHASSCTKEVKAMWVALLFVSVSVFLLEL
jgi:hypothetical protein